MTRGPANQCAIYQRFSPLWFHPKTWFAFTADKIYIQCSNHLCVSWVSSVSCCDISFQIAMKYKAWPIPVDFGHMNLLQIGWTHWSIAHRSPVRPVHSWWCITILSFSHVDLGLELSMAPSFGVISYSPSPSREYGWFSATSSLLSTGRNSSVVRVSEMEVVRRSLVTTRSDRNSSSGRASHCNYKLISVLFSQRTKE